MQIPHRLPRGGVRHLDRHPVRFEQSDDFEGPDNITVSPHGYAVMCTDGDDANQFLAGITPGARRSHWPTTG